MRNLHCASICIAGLLLTSLPIQASAADSWSYEASPFLWAAGIDGREGARGVVSDVQADFKDLIDFVDIGAALRIEARRPPVGWFGEASFVSLGDDATLPSGAPARFKSSQTFAEGGLRYELNSAFAVYGGLRFQSVETKIEIGTARLDDTQEWIDGMVGGRWTPLVSDHWVLWARADVGAGSSDLIWLAEVGGGYRWGDRWGTYVGYRVLDTDYEHGGFVYDVRQSGLLFGFGFRF